MKGNHVESSSQLNPENVKRLKKVKLCRKRRDREEYLDFQSFQLMLKHQFLSFALSLGFEFCWVLERFLKTFLGHFAVIWGILRDFG